MSHSPFVRGRPMRYGLSKRLWRSDRAMSRSERLCYFVVFAERRDQLVLGLTAGDLDLRVLLVPSGDLVGQLLQRPLFVVVAFAVAAVLAGTVDDIGCRFRERDDGLDVLGLRLATADVAGDTEVFDVRLDIVVRPV